MYLKNLSKKFFFFHILLSTIFFILKIFLLVATPILIFNRAGDNLFVFGIFNFSILLNYYIHLSFPILFVILMISFLKYFKTHKSQYLSIFLTCVLFSITNYLLIKIIYDSVLF